MDNETKRQRGGLATRFVLDKDGQWIAMQVNASEESLRGRESTPYEQAVVVVPNRLSAAAPELLETAKEVCKYLRAWDTKGDPLDRRQAVLWGRKLRAAIAKASGED